MLFYGGIRARGGGGRRSNFMGVVGEGLCGFSSLTGLRFYVSLKKELKTIMFA